MKKYLRLNDGNNIPIIGLGTWKSEKNLVGNAVKFAIINAGYRHIDCASIYQNEKEIGEIFKNIFNKRIKREKVFITSKLWNTDHKRQDVEKACKLTLYDLQLKYLDLYLIHWGVAFKHGGDLEPIDKNGKAITAPISIQETWQAMEDLVKKGLAKSIGVANFTTMMLVDLLTYAKIKPVANQIELHPYNTQTKLVDFCKYKNIVVTAYSPLGRQGATTIQRPKLFSEPLIKKLASKYKKTEAQILLNWGIGRNTVVIPKSVHLQRIKENFDIFNFELSQEDQNKIEELNRNHRFVNPVEWWGIPYFE